ncbi:vacuolar protein sorting-associated protein [Holotrichia oblita]|uniref:Vacuolar protein sorting-associated protein n=1 Tax=Holotrichia oblita TaxID=644536 RepID=A0ACB9SSZ9_HOLOL|nr:vacuolar protein sorting-associated protein [Holotrichia oblita]
MTSMFHQFEQPSQNVKNDSLSAAEMSALGFIQMKEPDEPIFQKTKKNLNITDKITHVALSNKYLYVAMANSSGTLLRINLSNSQQEEISLSKYMSTGRLSNLFVDPSGNHLLLTFFPNNSKDSPELCYLSRKSNKLKTTTKFRGHEFTEIGWNRYTSAENTTGSILLGTSKGLIFETEIVLEGEKFFTSGFSSSLEQYWRQVFDIGKGTNTPITGLEFYQIPMTDKYFIFVATPISLYYFDGKINSTEKPLLQQIFNKYLNVLEDQTCFKQTDTQPLRYSRLKLWSDEPNETPKFFVWLTNKGIRYGKIEPLFNEEKRVVKDIIKEYSEVIPFPKPSYVDMSVSPKYPMNIVATQFHVLLAYSDTIKGISLLSKELVYEDNYNEAFGKLINIVRDHFTNSVWAITENHLYKFIITKEERHVWQFYCDKQEFELAKKFSEDNKFHYNQVLIKEADMLFNKKEYMLSAERYAATQSGFEDICLKFIEAKELEALKVFLCKKLEKLTPHDQAQITMIVLCVIELFLDQLEYMRLQNQEQLPAYHDLQKHFESFLTLKHVSDCVKTNKTSIYNLIASHGDKDNLSKLTIVNKDFEQLIKQHIYNNDYCEALDVLKGQNNIELYYQFTPILIQEIPKLMVKALIEQKRHLMPVKLLPAFVSCDQEHQCIQVVKYLEFCKDHLKTSEKAIHNLLLTLYAKYNPQKLMEYLDYQGQNLLMVQYDVYFALRLCQERNLTMACVQLSALLGLWESAVDLALTIDPKKAKEIANMSPQNDVELRKKLWLKIAEFVISNKDEKDQENVSTDTTLQNENLNDIEKAMVLLQECDLLRIEDILPFFSDFETIDHFRTAICNSLKEYNQHIQDLKDEMDEAAKSAELIRKEIQSFRNRYTEVNQSDCCDICEKTLMVRPFYAFPCQHRFHSDCLLKELNPLLGPARKNKLADLHRQLNILNTQNIDNVSTASSGMSARDTVKADIDNIVASECLYCGENMIRNIDMPFVDDNVYDRIMKEWE